jgi:LmbE family N-acetylglucosaminyl deacetylase
VDGHVAVVSPHLDDAVLSLGAAIARWARDADVELVTVFAGDPGSTGPASTWDRRAGFETEGAAIKSRREEDRLACSLVGARPVWLPFREAAYDPAQDVTAVRAALAEAVAAAGTVLLPGPPFAHPDHARVVSLALEGERLGVYLAQPYAAWAAGGRDLPQFETPVALDDLRWEHIRVGRRERRAKRRAVAAYRSQLPLLGLAGRAQLPLRRLLRAEARAGWEALAWLPARSTTLSSR